MTTAPAAFEEGYRERLGFLRIDSTISENLRAFRAPHKGTGFFAEMRAN